MTTYGSTPWKQYSHNHNEYNLKYIREYFAYHCNPAKDAKFNNNREANLDFFASGEFLKDYVGWYINDTVQRVKNSERWNVLPKAPAYEEPRLRQVPAPVLKPAPVKPQATTQVVTRKNQMQVTGLTKVATARRTNRRWLMVDSNGEYWTNGVHGNEKGEITVQSEWRDPASGADLRSRIRREFKYAIPTTAVIHIIPCHPAAVVRKQVDDLLNNNIIVEGDWEDSTWVSTVDGANGTYVIAASPSRATARSTARAAANNF